MTRTRKILGPRPDPRPEIPAAGYVLEKNGLSSATDCLDHGNRDPYRKTTLEAPMANLPGKLPLNITELTPKARNMTHGVKPIVGPPAAEVVFPKPLHPLLEERERRREKNYHRREHKVLGRSLPTGSKLPAFTAHPDFRFGMSTIEEETAKEIMYPVEIPEEDESVRRQYVISHWSFAPGQRRNHYGPNFIVPERKLESGRIYNDNDGNRAKETLYWTEERAKELQTFVVTKRLSDWQKKRRPEIGKVHDPIHDTIEHLPTDHIFGIRFPPDDYSVGDLIGYGKSAKKNAGSPEDGITDDQLNCPQDASTWLPSTKSKLCETLTPKITSTALSAFQASDTRTFGVPTIRQKRRPGYMKRLADNTNYGDELDAKALLIPIPSNLYGDDILSKLRLGLKKELRQASQEETSKKIIRGPAKVHAVEVN